VILKKVLYIYTYKGLAQRSIYLLDKLPDLPCEMFAFKFLENFLVQVNFAVQIKIDTNLVLRK